jgi:UDP-glucose 4-epimerase
MEQVEGPVGERPRILVTGGAGYIGSHVVLAVLDAGYDAIVLDNLSTGVRSVVDPRATFVEGDVEDTPAVTALIKNARIDAVVHLAAFIDAAESLEKPLDYYLNNTAASAALLRSCVAAGVESFVFSSSAAVYGQPPQALVDETAPTHPATPYGASKRMAERILEDVARAHGLRHCALRYFNVAGADPKGRTGQRSGATNLIKMVLDTAMGRRPALSVYGNDFDTADGSGVRDYIHVSDLAAAHVLVLQRLLAKAPVPAVLNCGYGRGSSVFEVVKAARSVTGRDVPWELAPRRPGDLAAVVADNGRIKALGWTPRHDSLEAMIGDAWNWELSGDGHA